VTALEQRDRLARMMTDKTEFMNKLQANRMSDFKVGGVAHM